MEARLGGASDVTGMTMRCTLRGGLVPTRCAASYIDQPLNRPAPSALNTIAPRLAGNASAKSAGAPTPRQRTVQAQHKSSSASLQSVHQRTRIAKLWATSSWQHGLADAAHSRVQVHARRRASPRCSCTVYASRNSRWSCGVARRCTHCFSESAKHDRSADWSERSDGTRRLVQSLHDGIGAQGQEAHATQRSPAPAQCAQYSLTGIASACTGYAW